MWNFFDFRYVWASVLIAVVLVGGGLLVDNALLDDTARLETRVEQISAGMTNEMEVLTEQQRTELDSIATSFQESLELYSGAMESYVDARMVAQDGSGVEDLLKEVSALRESITLLEAAIQNQRSEFDKLKSSYIADIAVLKNKVADLEEDIEDISGETSSTGTIDVTFDVETWGDFILEEEETKLEAQVRLVVTNEGTRDLEEIELLILFEPDEYLTDLLSSSLTGGSTIWSKESFSSVGVSYSNNTKFDLDSGEEKEMFLTLRINFSQAQEYEIRFRAIVELEDYS